MVRSAIISLAAATAVSALAIDRRQDDSSSSGGLDDPTILNFALTLEHLEAAFYADALKNYTEDMFNDGGFSDVRPRIEEISADEAQHVEFLTSALQAAGAEPVGASTYTFPSTDVKSFLGLSQILEGVGVSAYLGAAPAISDATYLGAAGSILTVEARHNAYIRYINGQSPFPGPEDAALSPKSVVTLAAAFFAPGAANAPTIEPFPALTVTAQGDAAVGGTVMAMAAEGAKMDGQIYCAFISGLMTGFSEYDMGATSCMIPTANVTAGQTYVLLTSSMAVSDESTIAGPGVIDIGDAPMGTPASQGSSSDQEGGDSDSGASSYLPSAWAGVTVLAALAFL